MNAAVDAEFSGRLHALQGERRPAELRADARRPQVGRRETLLLDRIEAQAGLDGVAAHVDAQKREANQRNARLKVGTPS